MLWGNVKAGIGGGNDGITPHIGLNGNWYIGDTDTGVKAKGDDGKSVELQTAGGYVQWRQTGGSWANLFKIPADGDPGQNAFLYVAYASDDQGSDFSLIPSNSLKYRAEIQRTAPLVPPVAGDFSGATWVKYIGDDGEDGEDGIDGDSAYVYIAYASDDSGTDFTTTFDPALDYIAILATYTEIPSPAVGDFAGLWKNLGGSGSEYSWNVNSSQQIIGYLTEPANIAVNVDGTGSVSESVAAGDVVVTAINANGETTPADVPAFDVLTDSTQAVISWDDVDGATAYRVYDAATGNYTETTSLNIDYLTFSPATAGSVPTENTAAIYQTPTEIENGDTVDIVGEGIDVETKVDEGDSTKKIVSLKKQQSDWDEEDTESPNYIANKPTVSGDENVQSDWNQTDTEADDFIKNKPTISPGVDNFIDLTDTPSVYTGQAGKIPIVNATEDGLEFVSICDLIINCTIVQQIINVIEEEHNLFFQTVNFGLLYNRYAAQDNISQLSSSDDWGLPTVTILSNLSTYVGGNPPLGGLMKEVSLNSWVSISPLSDNSLALNFKGSGTRRQVPYDFIDIKQKAYIWHTGTINRGFELRYNKDNLYTNTTGLNGNQGGSVRLVRAASGQADGKKGIYIGNNGRVYRTIVVNEIEWLADNLAETKWRSGTDILEITDLSTWMSTTDPALCAYNNDWSNV